MVVTRKDDTYTMIQQFELDDLHDWSSKAITPMCEEIFEGTYIKLKEVE